MTMNETLERQKTLKAVLHYFFQDNTRSGSHSRYNLKYHIVWITKYRRSFLVGELAERLGQMLGQIARDYQFAIIAHEVMPDHVHILIEAPPKYAPSRIVQILKSISARLMRREFLDVIERYIWKEGTLWASGYYMASVGDGVTTEVVREYINNQRPMERPSSQTPDSGHHPPDLS